MQEEQLGLAGIQGLEPLPLRFTIVEASKATGKSTDAIRRAIKAGKVATTRNPLNNAYEMTLEALIKGGFDLTEARRNQVTAVPVDIQVLEARVKLLEEQLTQVKEDKERLFSLLELSQRALEAGPAKRRRFFGGRGDR